MTINRIQTFSSSPRLGTISSVFIVLFYLVKSEQYPIPLREVPAFTTHVRELVQTTLTCYSIPHLIDISAGNEEASAFMPHPECSALFTLLERNFSLLVRLRLDNHYRIFRQQHSLLWLIKILHTGFSDETTHYSFS
jgi:hypothetical protein